MGLFLLSRQCYLLWIIVGFCYGLPALAVDEPAVIPKISVGVSDYDYYPFHGINNDNEFFGIAREILDAFATWRGISFEYLPAPIERQFRDLVDGDIAMKYPDDEEWGRHVKGTTTIAYSDPVVPFIEGLLVRPSDKPHQVDDIKQFATMLGFTLQDFWQERVDNGKVKRISVKHYDSLLLMALVGERIDGVYANVDVGLHRLQQIKLGKSDIPIPPRLQKEGTLVFAAELPHVRSSYRLSSHTHPELIKDFNRFLVEQSDKIAELKHKYHLQAE
jgi:hypothetical protein